MAHVMVRYFLDRSLVNEVEEKALEKRCLNAIVKLLDVQGHSRLHLKSGRAVPSTRSFGDREQAGACREHARRAAIERRSMGVEPRSLGEGTIRRGARGGWLDRWGASVSIPNPEYPAGS